MFTFNRILGLKSITAVLRSVNNAKNALFTHFFGFSLAFLTLMLVSLAGNRFEMKRTKAEIEILFKKLLADIEQGASLRSAIKKHKPLSSQTFTKWCDNDESMAKRYARATEKRAEAIFEDILNIADENHKDVYIDNDGIERTDHDVVQRARLRVDARKWVLAKMHPTKYGDKLDVTSDNKALGVPAIIGMTIKNEITPPADESDDDLN